MLPTQQLRIGRRPQRFTKSMLTVLSLLVEDGPITSYDLAMRLPIAKRTVTYALRRLVKEGLVRSCVYLLDARLKLYAAYIDEDIDRDVILKLKETNQWPTMNT